MKPFSRRDFLKLAALTPLTWFARPLIQHSQLGQRTELPNVIILDYLNAGSEGTRRCSNEQDLYPSNPAIALEMQQELLDKINDVNRPYMK